jgi:hypothetical protein
MTVKSASKSAAERMTGGTMEAGTVITGQEHGKISHTAPNDGDVKKPVVAWDSIKADDVKLEMVEYNRNPRVDVEAETPEFIKAKIREAHELGKEHSEPKFVKVALPNAYYADEFVKKGRRYAAFLGKGFKGAPVKSQTNHVAFAVFEKPDESNRDGLDIPAIRAWAIDQTNEDGSRRFPTVGTRGKLVDAVISAYREAHDKKAAE